MATRHHKSFSGLFGVLSAKQLKSAATERMPGAAQSDGEASDGGTVRAIKLTG